MSDGGQVEPQAVHGLHTEGPPGVARALAAVGSRPAVRVGGPHRLHGVTGVPPIAPTHRSSPSPVIALPAPCPATRMIPELACEIGSRRAR